MTRSLLAGAIMALCVAGSAQSAVRDIYPDTWVASDALGRTMPSYQQVGPVKKDQSRVVGIFYITWHTENNHNPNREYTADVDAILHKDPAARLDGKHPLWKDGSFHWGEPECGYFLSQDEYVIRRDISMLADAGVDVLIMDVTNAVRYWDEWNVLFPVMQKMKAEGNKVPKVCFWAFNGPCITVVQDLYDRIYKQNKYKDLWFEWQGKPLILLNGTPSFDANGNNIQNPNLYYDANAKTDKNNPHYGDPKYTTEFLTDYPDEIKQFFTTRTMWWGYYKWGGKRFIGTEDNWSFGYDLGDPNVKNMNPSDLISTHKGAKEEAAVTPAQHPISLVGKSWSRDGGEPELNEYDMPARAYVPWLKKTVSNPTDYGIYFQDRWDEALADNPQFIYINDWNEWTAGKYATNDQFLQRKSDFFFVDQYNAEFNRSVSPMKGGYSDNYYMQMAQNIRKYKGIRPIPVNHGISDISINAKFNDWAANTVEYRDTVGDVVHRNHPGYGNNVYINKSGRNDIIMSKAAVDEKNIYFYVQTDQQLSPYTDPNWMLLMIDTDQDPSTGWYGYDYIINKNVVNSDTTTICKYVPGTAELWKPVGEIKYRQEWDKMEIAVPRSLLGLKGDKISFDFKWADNPADLKDPISLCVNGDTAPNRRFAYRFIWEK